MNPKMTVRDAAAFLGMPEKKIVNQLISSDLPFSRLQNSYYFDHVAARQIFKLKNKPKSIAFQIVKGGTGKTSMAQAFAVRANLYGLKVLCIDLDQQGNLTHTFDVEADDVPVMIDILAEGWGYEDSIKNVYPGLDILASRIENALLDDVIKMKKMDLMSVYRPAFEKLKEEYDLIVVDCPPNLGNSVAAITLAVDQVVAPVVPENFALAGLKATCNAVGELQGTYNKEIGFAIALNKYDARTILSQDALQMLLKHPNYRDHLLSTYVRMSQEFPNAIAKGQSIFDTVKPTFAKDDIDGLTQQLLGIDDNLQAPSVNKKRRVRAHRLEASLS